MSNQGRYRKVFVKLFRQPAFRVLCDRAKLLTLYVLAGPQSNRLGIYVFSIATAAEDLHTSPATLSKQLASVCAAFGWRFDKTARVIYIPSHWTWNRPENPNVLTGSFKDLDELPPSELVDCFLRNIETLPETLHETFRQESRKRLAKGMPNQDQDQETRRQEQKQECTVARDETIEPDHLPEGDAALIGPVVRLSSGKQIGRIFLHRWQLDALIAILGLHAATFGLDEWLDSLNKHAALSTLPRDSWKWVQSELHAEIARRALPVVEEPTTEPTNKQIAGLIKGGEAFLQRRRAQELSTMETTKGRIE